MRFIGILIVLIFSYLNAFAKAKVEPNANLPSNCGQVIAVKVLPQSVEVVFHPENSPPMDKGGNNRGEPFNKSEFDLQLVTSAALEVMKNEKLVFCVGSGSADKNKAEPRFYVALKNGNQP